MALSLDKSIQSVLAQSFTDWELLIVDNCSTDHPDEIVKRYSDDKRIRLLSIDEKDRSKARNHGIANSNGDYITFLDADDTLHEDYLKTYQKIFEVQPDVLCISDLMVIQNKVGKVLMKSARARLHPFIYALNFGHISIALPRDTIVKYKFEDQYGEDRILMAKLSDEIDFVFTRQPFYIYNDDYVINSEVHLKKRFEIELNSLTRLYSNICNKSYGRYTLKKSIFDYGIRNFYVAKSLGFNDIAKEILYSDKLNPYSLLTIAKFVKALIYYYAISIEITTTDRVLTKDDFIN